MPQQFSNVYIDATASVTRKVEERDVELFASLTGDANPIHLNDEYAAQSRFGRRIAHGLLVSGYISAVLGTLLPGPGSIYLGQNLRFLAPVYLGDTITVTVVVKEVRKDKPVVKLLTKCINQHELTVIDGEATMLCPELHMENSDAA